MLDLIQGKLALQCDALDTHPHFHIGLQHLSKRIETFISESILV